MHYPFFLIPLLFFLFFFFFFNDTATTEIYTLSLHDALPTSPPGSCPRRPSRCPCRPARSEEHTSELQSRPHLVCRLLLEKKKKHPSTLPTRHGTTYMTPTRLTTTNH